MQIEFVLNGKQTSLDVPGEMKLLDCLREVLGLTGTKSGCEIGQCGACSVLIDHKLERSCLILMRNVANREITTIEGIHGPDGGPNDLQEAFLKYGAVQCGFCTPGMVIAAEALLHQNLNPTREDIKSALSKNLCRCSGYHQIFDAIEETATNRRNQKS